MTRRKSSKYGDVVPPSRYGHVDRSIGKAVASGNVGILQPTKPWLGLTMAIAVVALAGVVVFGLFRSASQKTGELAAAALPAPTFGSTIPNSRPAPTPAPP